VDARMDYAVDLVLEGDREILSDELVAPPVLVG